MIELLRLGLAGRREYFAQISVISEIISRNQQYRNRISDLDLEDFFSRIIEGVGSRSLQKITPALLKSELARRLLCEEKDFDFYYPVGDISGFTEGALLGMGELISLRSLPAKVRRDVKDSHTMRYSKSAVVRVNPEKEWFLHIRIKSIGTVTAALRAEAYARMSLGAYEALTGYSEFLRGFIRDPFTMDAFVMWPDEDYVGYIKPVSIPGHIAISGTRDVDGQLDDITRILRKEPKSELENRILSAVNILALTDDSTPLNIRFLLKVFALEGLLLSESDRDYLGWRLAEKVAFILGDNKVWMAFAFGFFPHLKFIGNLIPTVVSDEFVAENRVESRLMLNREVTRLYAKRSAFAHPHQKGKNAINDYDYDTISWLVRLCIASMLELSKTGITHLRKEGPDDSKSLDGMIERMKFRGTLQLGNSKEPTSQE